MCVQNFITISAGVWISISPPPTNRQTDKHLYVHFYIYFYTSHPGPGTAREKFDELTSFGVWGTLGSGGWLGAVMLVLRTIPGLVGRSVQNLVEIGPVVWA